MPGQTSGQSNPFDRGSPGPGPIAPANNLHRDRPPVSGVWRGSRATSYWNKAKWLMPNPEILRLGPATPARQTVSSVCCTIMIGVSLGRPLGQTVTPAVRQSAPAKDRVAYSMTFHERYILQAIASQVEIRIAVGHV